MYISKTNFNLILKKYVRYIKVIFNVCFASTVTVFVYLKEDFLYMSS